MVTEWKAIGGYEGLYEVSDAGQVRSLTKTYRHGRNGSAKTTKPGQVRAVQADKNGRRQVQLSRDGRKKIHRVHILVLEAFVGPRPAGLHGCHRDDDRSNNSVGNLYWGTRSQNMHDSVRNGSHANAKKATCRYGHEYTDENTYVTRKGTRQCKVCRRQTDRARYASRNHASYRR